MNYAVPSLMWVLALFFQRHGAFVAGSASPNAATSQKDKLYLLTLLPYPDSKPTLQPSWPEGPSILPAIELAVEHINNKTDILAQYKLDLINVILVVMLSQKRISVSYGTSFMRLIP